MEVGGRPSGRCVNPRRTPAPACSIVRWRVVSVVQPGPEPTAVCRNSVCSRELGNGCLRVSSVVSVKLNNQQPRFRPSEKKRQRSSPSRPAVVVKQNAWELNRPAGSGVVLQFKETRGSSSRGLAPSTKRVQGVKARCVGGPQHR